METIPSPGQVYRHFKGNLYVVIAVGTHTETYEAFVCYVSVKDSRAWVRPLSMWNEKISNGAQRFTRIEE